MGDVGSADATVGRSQAVSAQTVSDTNRAARGAGWHQVYSWRLKAQAAAARTTAKAEMRMTSSPQGHRVAEHGDPDPGSADPMNTCRMASTP